MSPDIVCLLGAGEIALHLVPPVQILSLLKKKKKKALVELKKMQHNFKTCVNKIGS